MKSRKKAIILIPLVIIALVFVAVLGIKEYSLYSEYSDIEEIHANELIENPDDYGLVYNQILFYCYCFSYDTRHTNLLIYLNNGSVVSATCDRAQLSVFLDAERNGDEKAFWSAMDYTYKGNVGGRQLYTLMRWENRINYDSEYYSIEEAYRELTFKMNNSQIPETKDNWWGSNKSPYISFIMFDEEGGAFPIWEEESDGITYYLYDKNAEKVVYSTIDSSFFDQWMAENWGEDWKEKITIYRSKNDLAVPKW